MSSETIPENQETEADTTAPEEGAEDGRITVMWYPVRPWLNYVSAAVVAFVAFLYFRDYVLDPHSNAKITGILAVLAFGLVILRLLIGATSVRRTVLDLDAGKLMVSTRRLGVRSNKTYRPRDFTHVVLRQRKPPTTVDPNIANTDILTLSLYSENTQDEIKCAQSLSPGEMHNLAWAVAEIFNVQFDGEVHDPKAINIFWPD